MGRSRKRSYSDIAADALKQMADSSIKVSFDRTRDDVSHPWFNAELFTNFQLKAAAGSLLMIPELFVH